MARSLFATSLDETQVDLVKKCFGEKEINKIVDEKCGKGWCVAQIRLFTCTDDDQMTVPRDLDTEGTIRRADLTLKDDENQTKLLQLFLTRRLEAFHFVQQTDAYSHSCRNGNYSQYSVLLPQTCHSVYYPAGRPGGNRRYITEWSITDSYHVSLYELLIGDSADLVGLSKKVGTLLQNMFRCGLVHGELTPWNIVFRYEIETDSFTTSSTTPTSVTGPAKVTFLNYCMGGKNMENQYHMYDIMYLLKSTCETLATDEIGCSFSKYLVLQNLQYLQEVPELRMLLYNPSDYAGYPYANVVGTQLGQESKTDCLEGIFYRTTGNGEKAVINSPQQETDVKDVNVDMEAVNNLGSYLHKEIFKGSDEADTTESIVEALGKQSLSDKMETIRQCLNTVVKQNPSDFINHEFSLEYDSNVQVKIVKNLTGTDRKKKQPKFLGHRQNRAGGEIYDP